MSGSDNQLRVAIVHDWLVGGGAEKVVQAIHQIYPDAPIYTSYSTDEWRKRLDNKVVTGWLQNWPFGRLRKFIPFLRIWWFSRLDLSGYDLVISSSGAEAKGIKVPPATLHINYCHAPTHYYWSRYDEYMQHPGFGVLDPLARLGLKLLVGPLRAWDLRAAARPNYMVANSSHTKAEIKKYYDRDAVVIHPPVDISRFEAVKTDGKRHGLLAGGRLTPYKRYDLAVMACTKLNLPLTIFGDGPDRQRLQQLAGPSVTFTGWASDQDVAKYFTQAEGYIFASQEDFGVVGIEALAAGTPVIAYRAAGALDYVQPGKTGLFFDQQTAESLENTLRKFDPSKFDNNSIKKAALQFAPEVFDQKMRSFIKDKLSDFGQTVPKTIK